MAIKPVEILITAKDKASSVFGSLRSTAAAAGAAIAAYFGVKSFVGAVQGAAELEAKLSEVRAVSGAIPSQMTEIARAAQQAGTTTKYSSAEAADALGNLARAGLNVAQSIQALPPTLQLAQVGQIDLGQAAEITTRILAGFGMQAEQSGRIADVLAKGADSSNTSVTGLAQALSYAAPTAVSLGLSLEQTVAIIGKFADAGIDASRAGTALNSILAQFSDPASKFRAELAALGITTNDFEQALVQLEGAGAKGQKAILAVGMEAGPALRSLLNQGTGALLGLKQQLLEAEGAAAQTAATMDDNLVGSARSLASVWDTVKNVLTTPVLPVLRDGIKDLTQALRTAVSDGTIERFGNAIAKGFQAALEWGRAFIGQIDVDALVQKFNDGADKVSAAFTTVQTYATNAGNTVQLVWGVMASGANGVLTAIFTVATAFSETAAFIVRHAANISEAMSKIAITDDARNRLQAEAAMMRDVLAGLEGVTTEFAARANAAMEGVASNAQIARDGWAGLTGQTGEAAKAAATSAKVFDQVGETLKEVGGDATALGQKAAAAAVLQTEAARKSREEVARLKTEYEAALKAGDVQAAVAKLEQMKTALKGTADQAAGTSRQVADAFARMGIQTQAELTQAAENARRDFETIKASGQATAEGLRQAFQQYAEAAIAANGGVASDMLKAEASMRGLKITTDETGRSIVQVMNEARDATSGVGDVANSAAGGFQNMARSAAQAAAAAKTMRDINNRHGRPGEHSQQQNNEADYDPGRNMYSRPGEDPRNGNGETQAEYQRRKKLEGQGAVDNTTMFMLRDKLKRGLLTADDLPALQGVLAANVENDKIARGMGPGAWSVEGKRDWMEWQNTMALFKQAVAKFGGAGGAAVGRTTRVEINTRKGKERVDTNDAGMRAIVRALQDAQIDAGG